MTDLSQLKLSALATKHVRPLGPKTENLGKAAFTQYISVKDAIELRCLNPECISRRSSDKRKFARPLAGKKGKLLGKADFVGAIEISCPACKILCRFQRI